MKILKKIFNNQKPKVDILLLTIDRYELTVKCVGNALKKSGIDYNLFVCDNGSKDKRTIAYIKSLNPTCFIKNLVNLGIGKMYNKLMLKGTAPFIAIIDNDIELPINWLKDATEQYTTNDGIMGFKCVEGPNVNNVYGTKFFSRKRFEEIGGFNEKFGLYGLEDSDLNERMIKAGYINRYIGTSYHLGVGKWDEGEYRKMKDKALTDAAKQL